MSAEDQKRRAALRALDDVQNGMRLGLGSGSTAAHFVDVLAESVAQGLDVICVPTSEATAGQARAGGISLTTLDEMPELDLTVDGTDEFDDTLTLIKGGGGAHLREKIVALASKQLTIIADASKHVKTLGKFALPVEVVPFGARVTVARLERVAREFGCQGPITQRTKNGEVFFSDGGHLIYDCAFGEIADAASLGVALNAIPGVVEHGLFVSIATKVIVGTDDDTIVIS